MGKGKADVDYWAARIRPGTILFELAGVSETRAREAFFRVAMKMPIRCRMIGRRVEA
jgi:large subunit ribosomal protein L16